MSHHPGYPKNLDDKISVYGYGGIRIYSVTKEQADEIAKEFPKSFTSNPPYSPPADGEQLFYMNANHGEHHYIFSLSLKSEQQQATIDCGTF